MNKIIAHIGAHRTGSTSFQSVLFKNRYCLINNNVFVYDMSVAGKAFLSCARDGTKTAITDYYGCVDKDQLWYDTKNEIDYFRTCCNLDTAVITQEDISLFNTEEEWSKFRNLFSFADEVEVLLVVRDHKEQIKSAMKRRSVKDAILRKTVLFQEDPLYVRDIDMFESLLIEAGLKLKVLQYDKKDMVTKLINSIGMPEITGCASDNNEIYLNKSF